MVAPNITKAIFLTNRLHTMTELSTYMQSICFQHCSTDPQFMLFHMHRFILSPKIVK